jgi:hypothetical protein
VPAAHWYERWNWHRLTWLVNGDKHLVAKAYSSALSTTFAPLARQNPIDQLRRAQVWLAKSRSASLTDLPLAQMTAFA